MVNLYVSLVRAATNASAAASWNAAEGVLLISRRSCASLPCEGKKLAIARWGEDHAPDDAAVAPCFTAE